MATSRIPTLAQHQLITSAALRTQRQVSDFQLQVTTGKKSQSFSGIAKDTGRLLTLKSEVSNAQQFLQNIVVVEKRLDLMEFSLEQLDDLARQTRTDLINALNGSNANRSELDKIMQARLNQVVDLLNTRDDSRFLFAGGKVTTKPVDLNNGVYTTPSPPPFDTTADTGYYDGDSVVQSARLDEDFVINYGIKADESAFEKIIRTLDTIAQMTFSDPITATEQQVIRDSITTLSQAIDDNGSSKTVTDLISDVGLDRVQLGAIRDKHTTFNEFLLTSIADIENVDTAEALANLNFQQTQLEVSFAAIARAQTVSLNDFLR
jgi:flagellar hook-associated protein 3 FlgL